MVHIYGSCIWFIKGSYEFFLCSTPPPKQHRALKRPNQAVDPLYFMSYVIHLRRLWVTLVLGLRSLDSLARKRQANLEGAKKGRFRAPPWSSEKMGSNVSHVCLPKVDFWSFKKSYHVLKKKRVMGFFVGFLQGKFLHLRLKGFWLLTKRATSEIRHRCWGLIQSLYWRNLRENQNKICTLVVSSFTTGRMNTGNQSCLLRHHKMSQNASFIIFFPKWSFETRSKSIWQLYSARF